MMQKNHDYGEAWRDMLVSTFTDMILMRLLRIRQIQSSDGKTIMSEGIDANFADMINYSVFALILKYIFYPNVTSSDISRPKRLLTQNKGINNVFFPFI